MTGDGPRSHRRQDFPRRFLDRLSPPNHRSPRRAFPRSRKRKLSPKTSLLERMNSNSSELNSLPSSLNSGTLNYPNLELSTSLVAPSTTIHPSLTLKRKRQSTYTAKNLTRSTSTESLLVKASSPDLKRRKLLTSPSPTFSNNSRERSDLTYLPTIRRIR